MGFSGFNGSGREDGWWRGLDSNQRTGNPGRFTVCCL
jgi:hypothetical protein